MNSKTPPELVLLSETPIIKEIKISDDLYQHQHADDSTTKVITIERNSKNTNVNTWSIAVEGVEKKYYTGSFRGTKFISKFLYVKNLMSSEDLKFYTGLYEGRKVFISPPSSFEDNENEIFLNFKRGLHQWRISLRHEDEIIKIYYRDDIYTKEFEVKSMEGLLGRIKRLTKK